MGSISLTAIPELIADLYPVMFQKYDSIPSIAEQVCEVKEVSQGWKGDRVTVVTSKGNMIEVLPGEPIPVDRVTKAYTALIRGRGIGRSVEIPLDDLEANDASTTVVAKLRDEFSNWGEEAKVYTDTLFADVLQKGTLSAGHLATFDNSFEGNDDSNAGFIYDGKALFATDHPLAAATGSYANLVTSRSLTAANLETTLTTMKGTNNVDDRGNKVTILPDVIITPPALSYTARKIVQSVQVAGSNNNDINVLMGELMPLSSAYIGDSASSAAWWVGKKGKGIRLYTSGRPTVTYQVDNQRRVATFTSFAKRGMGVTDWRYWFACNKAAS